MLQCRHCNRTSDRFNPYAHQCCACDSRNYRRVVVRIFTLRPARTIYHLYTLSFLETWERGDSTQGYRCGYRDIIYHPYTLSLLEKGARWLSGRVSDSGARGRGFETYRRRVVSLSKTLYSPKVLVNYPGSGGSVPT